MSDNAEIGVPALENLVKVKKNPSLLGKALLSLAQAISDDGLRTETQVVRVKHQAHDERMKADLSQTIDHTKELAIGLTHPEAKPLNAPKTTLTNVFSTLKHQDMNTGSLAPTTNVNHSEKTDSPSR